MTYSRVSRCPMTLRNPLIVISPNFKKLRKARSRLGGGGWAHIDGSTVKFPRPGVYPAQTAVPRGMSRTRPRLLPVVADDVEEICEGGHNRRTNENRLRES